MLRLSNLRIPTMLLTFSALFAVCPLLSVHAAQPVFVSGAEYFENIISIPKDPTDPSAWDYDWSFSGIR